MPFMRRGPFVLTALLVCLAMAAAQDEPAGAWGAEVELNSRYIWRSIPWSDGAVWQPSAWADWRGLEFFLWANLDLAYVYPSTRLNEIDVSLSYLMSWTILDVEPGIEVFIYPGRAEEDPTTAEASLSLGCHFGTLSVFLDQALDVWSYSGSYYAEAGLRWEPALGPSASLDIRASANFGSARFHEIYWGVPGRGFTSVSAVCGLEWPLGQGVFLRPRAEAHLLAGEDARLQAAASVVWAVGLGLGVER